MLPVTVAEETKAIGADTPFASRPAFARILAAIKKGDCRHIICRDLDRLTRDVKLGAELLDLCRENRVTLHTPSGPISLRSASDRFLYYVKSAASFYEKDATGDRVRRAKQEAIEQGRWQGPPAYGYTSQAHYRGQLIASGLTLEEAEAEACLKHPQKAKLYVDPKEAAIVKIIYQLSLEGLGSRWITNHLNSHGYLASFAANVAHPCVGNLTAPVIGEAATFAVGHISTGGELSMAALAKSRAYLRAGYMRSSGPNSAIFSLVLIWLTGCTP